MNTTLNQLDAIVSEMAAYCRNNPDKKGTKEGLLFLATKGNEASRLADIAKEEELSPAEKQRLQLHENGLRMMALGLLKAITE